MPAVMSRFREIATGLSGSMARACSTSCAAADDLASTRSTRASTRYASAEGFNLMEARASLRRRRCPGWNQARAPDRCGPPRSRIKHHGFAKLLFRLAGQAGVEQFLAALNVESRMGCSIRILQVRLAGVFLFPGQAGGMTIHRNWGRSFPAEGGQAACPGSRLQECLGLGVRMDHQYLAQLPSSTLVVTFARESDGEIETVVRLVRIFLHAFSK